MQHPSTTLIQTQPPSPHLLKTAHEFNVYFTRMPIMGCLALFLNTTNNNINFVELTLEGSSRNVIK
eukprot:scaffold14672_cov186-Alexandrium_tamarense.AAC.4